MKSDIQLVSIDRAYLLEHQDVLQQLCDLYCSIWEQDEHFGEYRQCPSCRRYFSYENVEHEGILECPTCHIKVVRAWLPVSVGLKLMETAHHHSFAGAILMNDQEVLGFSWGKLYSMDEMRGRWETTIPILEALNPSANFCFYLAELGVAKQARGHGFGTQLARKVFTQPLCRYPNVLGALATHKDSAAVGIYQKLGFTQVGNSPEGQGRIRMGIPSIGNVNLFSK